MDYQAEHTFYLRQYFCLILLHTFYRRQYCRLVLCQSGLSGRAYILHSPITSSGVDLAERTIRPSKHSTFANNVVWCCVRVDFQAEHTFYLRQYCRLVLCQNGQSGLSGRAYILPSLIVSAGVVSEGTIRPRIHSTFANSVVWCCIRADYQAEHTFYLRQLCRLVSCQSGLSGRAYNLPSPIVSSDVVSERTIGPSTHSTFAKSVVWCCVRLDFQAEYTFYLRQ